MTETDMANAHRKLIEHLRLENMRLANENARLRYLLLQHQRKSLWTRLMEAIWP